MCICMCKCVSVCACVDVCVCVCAHVRVRFKPSSRRPFSHEYGIANVNIGNTFIASVQGKAIEIVLLLVEYHS